MGAKKRKTVPIADVITEVNQMDMGRVLRQARRIEYLPLEQVQPALKNPKRHAEPMLDTSAERFGYTEPVLLDERTGRLVAGHGRLAMVQRLKTAGKPPPNGIEVDEDTGAWLLPVVRGWKSRNDTEAEAYLLASNQLTMAGGWDSEALTAMLADLAAVQAAEGIGWSPEELDKMLRSAAGEGGDVSYTDKIESPVYQPTGERPKAEELFDLSKAKALLAEIDDTPEVSDEDRTFLRAAAYRHVVFDYQSIAEFYAHADPQVQRLMEKSALVIIDYKRAVEDGFVKLTKSIAEAAGEQDVEDADA